MHIKHQSAPNWDPYTEDNNFKLDLKCPNASFSVCMPQVPQQLQCLRYVSHRCHSIKSVSDMLLATGATASKMSQITVSHRCHSIKSVSDMLATGATASKVSQICQPQVPQHQKCLRYVSHRCHSIKSVSDMLEILK